MTTPYIHEDFLLESATACELYHAYAEPQPIIDYHNHLPPDEIAWDRRFDNLTQIWLAGDHYKWRAMRTAGVDERFITGTAPEREKFQRWAEVVPKALRNPLYHWTHLELNRPFGINDRLLNPDTAESVWQECAEKLRTPEFSTRGILKRMNVRVVCTTDDPTDSLEHHLSLGSDVGEFPVKVLPTFRPDKAHAVDHADTFNAWVDKLELACNFDIGDYGSFLEGLRKRHTFFHDAGARLADNGLDTMYAEHYLEGEIRGIFAKVRARCELSREEVAKFKSAVLYELALLNHERGWVQQYHIGALRNNNSRLLRKVGADAGCDSINDLEVARPLSRFLDRLDRGGRLAKTVLYNLNPRDNDLFATMIGNFQDGSSPGKIQYGSGWWFLDQKDGMEKQLESLSNMGLLSCFIGMLTDSRSFLSFTRHEYFRRILCNLLGSEIERGILPGDVKLVGGMVADICYHNARRYFDFEGSLSVYILR